MGFQTAPWAFQVYGADWLNWSCLDTLYCVYNKTSNKIKPFICYCYLLMLGQWEVWPGKNCFGLELSWHLWFRCLRTLRCEFISDLGFCDKLEICFSTPKQTCRSSYTLKCGWNLWLGLAVRALNLAFHYVEVCPAALLSQGSVGVGSVLFLVGDWTWKGCRQGQLHLVGWVPK